VEVGAVEVSGVSKLFFPAQAIEVAESKARIANIGA
jgi:hypothetical protein